MSAQRRGSKTRLVVTAILLAANRDEVRHMHDYWRARGVTFYLNPLNDRAGTLGAEKFVELLPFGADASRSQLVHYNMSGCPSLIGFMGILVERRPDHVLHGLDAGARDGQCARARPL